MQSKNHIKIELLRIILISAFFVSLFCFGLGSWRYMMELLNTNLTISLILVFCFLFSIIKFKSVMVDYIINVNLVLSLIAISIGIIQLFGLIPSMTNYFMFTGTFYSITQYAMLLSFVFPICLLYYFRSKSYNKTILFSLLVILIIMTILSKCRSAIIAEVFAFIIILLSERPNLRSKMTKRIKIWLPWIVIISLVSIYLLYRIKVDSVNGRILMWLISFEMFLDKPILGFGLKGFESDYMLYQAKYFIANPDSTFVQLADNTYHPYNEFIRIAVCFGICGILILFSLIYIILRFARVNKGKWRPYLLASLATLFVWCLFSFPFNVSFIWVLSVSWLLILIEGIDLKNRD